MRAALVHYWLVDRRGGENVLEAIAQLLPGADLYANVIDPQALFGALLGREYQETFIGRIPLAKRFLEYTLPLMPLALESLDMGRYDLIVSSESGPAKWIIPHPEARHVCYCHSPMRYLWDQRFAYESRLNPLLRPLARRVASRLRQSDVLSSNRVDEFVANSTFVSKRIWRYWRRESVVIHPPVDTDRFTPVEPTEDYYLVAGELEPYKRIDLAVRACSELGRRLVVMGRGRERRRLERMAGPRVQFLGHVSDSEFRGVLSRCRALLFPGVEDFGIVPVEALACGRPVIAYAAGGALDTIEHGVSGLFFRDQSVAGLKRAIASFESEERSFRGDECVARSRLFTRERFLQRFGELLGQPS